MTQTDTAPRRLEIMPVFGGGYRLVLGFEWRSEDGREWSWDACGDEMVYPSRKAAEAAVERRRSLAG